MRPHSRLYAGRRKAAKKANQHDEGHRGWFEAFLLVLYVLFALLSAALTAPVVGSLRADQIAIAGRLLNGIIEKGASSDVAIIKGSTNSDTAMESANIVVELLTAARSQIVAAVQGAKTAGKVEVRAGTFLSGSVAGLGGSRHIDLAIYQHRNQLGDFTAGKSYQKSPVTPYAKFRKIP
jgi:hypothetical protein